MVTNNSWNSLDPAQVAKGGSGAATLTGVLTGNGTSAFTVSAITDNTVVMGSTSNLVQDTTITVTDAGEMVNASQPAFLAYLGTTDSDVTGNAATFTLGSGNALTEVFDQGGDFVTTGTFTAPVTGRYSFGFNIFIGDITAAMTYHLGVINTSNANYNCNFVNIGAVRTLAAAPDNYTSSGNILCDMDALDTTIFTVRIDGGAGDTADLLASGRRINVYGHLVC